MVAIKQRVAIFSARCLDARFAGVSGAAGIRREGS
jgi:hypothetical protein